MPTPITPPADRPTNRLISSETAPETRQRGRVMLLSYEAHQADFTGLNPLFAGVNFGTSARGYLKTADDASAYDTRAAARDQAFQAEDVTRDTAFRLLKPLYYAIGQAWPKANEKKTYLQAFGQKYYEPGRRTAGPLLELLNLALPAALEADNATALAAHGWGPAQYAALDAARVLLQKAHETAGRQTGLSGEQAIAYYRAQNEFYWFMQELNEAADVLYADEPAVEKEFRLGPAAPDRLRYTLKPGQTKALAHAPLGPDRVLRCTVKGAKPDPLTPNARLWLDFLPVEGADVERRVALEPTAPYQTQKVKVSELGDPGPLLAVENLTDEDATVVITVG